MFKFLKLARARNAGADPDSIIWRANGQTIRVGHFSLDYVRASGCFKAGCHFIPWDATRAVAERLGVFDVEASEEAVSGREHA